MIMGKKTSTFNAFMQGVIAHLKAEGHRPAAHVHRSALRSFATFMGREVRFHELTPLLLGSYETSLLRCGKSRNTISTYLRALRSTYNKAARQGLAERNPDLFHRVYTGVCAPTKRALTPDEVRRVLTAEVPDDLRQAQAWFSLLFLLRGMPFIDLAHLRKCDYDGHTLTYSRHKTHQPLCLAVLPEARVLIDRYADRSGSPYLFPILREDGENYGCALRTLNRQLGKLSQYVLGGKHLSSYTPRHSWATIAYHLDVPVGVVSRALGHTSIRTTESYLKPMQYGRIDAAHEQVLEVVYGKNKEKISA